MIKSLRMILVVFILISNVLTFYTKYEALINDFEYTVKSKEVLITRHMESVRGYIEIIKVFGDTYYLKRKLKDSEFYKDFSYNVNKDGYNLDAIDINQRDILGNITGKGSIPRDPFIKDEINLALEFNPLFHKIYTRLPDVLRIYYISENHFVNLFPWVPSQSFHYSDTLNKLESYTMVTPKYDNTKTPLWAPVRLNQEGSGYILTYSAPIYNNQKFLGVVSIDFTNIYLSKMIDCEFEGFLVDQKNSIIATSNISRNENEIIQLDHYLKIKDNERKELNKIKIGNVQKLGGYYLYTMNFHNTPWTLYYQVPMNSIIIKSLFATLPILLISMFLLLTITEIDRRKKTEVLLKNSIDKLKSYQKLLENEAKMDFLTGIYNRRGFEDKFNEVIKKNGSMKPMSLLIGDIDYFKQYNDNYGHTFGDKVLTEVASILKKNTTDSHIVCRWGGEEFLILLTDQTYEDALIFGEMIRSDIESTIVKQKEKELHVTITIGVAEYDSNNTLKASIRKADQALYLGKEQGRNRVIGYKDLINS
jgi:diguanylate cyclase